MQHTIKADEGWRVWWQLTRPHTLTASFVPVLLGTLIAFRETAIDPVLFILMMLATLFLQAATNMFNEYYDFRRGLDTEHSVGIGGAIVRNGVRPQTVLGIALGLYLAAAVMGLYIAAHSSWMLLAVGGVAMAIGYLYTGGPYPIAYTPLGELFSGVVMGMAIVLISYFIQTGHVSGFALALSIPSMILVAAIMMSNNIRDLEGDKESGRKTVAILAGRSNAVTILAVFFIVSYAWIIGMVLFGKLTPLALLVLLSIPKPAAAIKTFRKELVPLKVMPAMKATAQTNTFFGLLLCIALFIEHWFL
ncbi:1,4-dihydroxy-2-naphthoate polyprenyltransferase [Edaphobacillus lindanitolerans]|uniref:1,4-dihydroxy-2-naphthoate octaprenyltransferase n=1 Tax=Edaphobacillus lindanitolerans TaxID=550447 RepID=A0A1U7PR09_9BACI|nr:1,4-dihydroxy-2-naphthoate polyprenyltransferase [Edaphobacillus lindanitolerans]SIT85835.1 1,4-dihydroxy-2-naphthoate prenyltransferase [Edaphobacillus lindanitolerans]